MLFQSIFLLPLFLNLARDFYNSCCSFQTFHPQLLETGGQFLSPNFERKCYLPFFWITAAAVFITAKTGGSDPHVISGHVNSKEKCSWVHLFANFGVTQRAALTNSTLLPVILQAFFHTKNRNSINLLELRNQSMLPKIHNEFHGTVENQKTQG